MTRKHFTELARALNSIRPESVNGRPAERFSRLASTSNPGVNYAGYETWWEAVRSVADVCESSNSLFDRGRFIKACEYGC